jgi:hypothetical protein
VFGVLTEHGKKNISTHILSQKVMKTLIQISLLSLLTFSTLAQSDSLQVDSTKTEPEVVAPTWKKTLNIGLSLSHTLNVNPPATSAPEEGFGSSVSIKASLNYIKDKSRFKVKNNLSWLMVLYKANGQTPTQNVSDILLTNHDLSYSFKKGGNWSINTIFNNTASVLTLFDGNYLIDQNALGPIQSFLNPYSVTISPGIKYDTEKGLGISISPYVFKIRGVTNQAIADKDIFFKNKANRILSDGHYKKSFQEQLGAGLQIWYVKNFGEWLSIDYKLIANSNYLENVFKNGTIEGQFTTNFIIYKGIGLTHTALLTGNFAQSPFKPFYNQVVVLSYTFDK